MYTVYLKKGEEKRILQGHPWIFANEVAKIEGKDAQGSIVRVVGVDGRFIGQGYINHHSKIIVRMLTRTEEVIDRDFFLKRIKDANDRRLALGYENNYRAVFGEADLLPALIVDKYGDYLSVQFLSLGMDVRKDMLVDCLIEVFKPKGIYERSDVSVRAQEGLQEFKGAIYGDFNPVVEIEENGLKLKVDLENGQKTGYFLDQKENRDNLKHYVGGKTVLDCFSNVGGFSLCAAKYGATEVTAVDVSPLAVSAVREHAKLNGFENITAVEGDVFEVLREYKREKRRFDVIVLDPPAFTKSRDTVMKGYRGYLDINAIALKLLNKGGYLITCSCSQHLTVKLFLDMIKEAAADAGAAAKLLELRTQGRDHATLLAMEESLYLKVAVVQVI